MVNEESMETSLSMPSATVSMEISGNNGEKNVLTGMEKKEHEKSITSPVMNSTTPSLSLSSALAFADNRSNVCNNTPNVSERSKRTSFPDFLRSPTGVCDFGAFGEGDMDLDIPDDLLLNDCEETECEKGSSMESIGNMSIESKCALVNSMIAKSYSDTISLMTNMREQSQKIQQKLRDLGEVPAPVLEVDVPLETKQQICALSHQQQNQVCLPLPNPKLLQRQQQGPQKRRRASGKETFPMKLHRLLLDLENFPDGESIATFFPDGNAFIIKDSELFEKRVLHKYFPKMKNFSSFHRQLNLYDFERLGSFSSVCHTKGAYCHSLFRKDQPNWASLMRPTRIKGNVNKS